MTQNTADRLYLLLVDRLRVIGGPVIGGLRHAAEDIAAVIDALTAERDEARGQLQEARAEVERLRPAAEAWRTLEAARKEERTGTDENEHAEYWVHILARNAARAADRARAAKEAKA